MSEAISGYFVVSAQNYLAFKLHYIVTIQITKVITVKRAVELINIFASLIFP